METRSAMGSFPVPPTFTARSNATNTGMGKMKAKSEPLTVDGTCGTGVPSRSADPVALCRNQAITDLNYRCYIRVVRNVAHDSFGVRLESTIEIVDGIEIQVPNRVNWWWFFWCCTPHTAVH